MKRVDIWHNIKKEREEIEKERKRREREKERKREREKERKRQKRRMNKRHGEEESHDKIKKKNIKGGKNGKKITYLPPASFSSSDPNKGRAMSILLLPLCIPLLSHCEPLLSPALWYPLYVAPPLVITSFKFCFFWKNLKKEEEEKK